MEYLKIQYASINIVGCIQKNGYIEMYYTCNFELEATDMNKN